ncbi:hypothetical protein GCM10028778_26060 [Barrientosiimonas marina]|uniref:DUF2269 domain-containing protein n=1 Tax=Lentibacillus kimchii TaxID=1542911 RepID=A0ABW2USG0_9BACI
MSFYDVLVFIHVFSAILGMGPGFILTYILTKARNMSELRHAYLIRSHLHGFVMVGGILLLVTGLWMGALNPALYSQGWYVLSLALFLIALAMGPLVLAPRSRPIKRLLREHQGETIPDDYYRMAKKLFFWEHLENIIFLLVIALMILKPF